MYTRNIGLEVNYGTAFTYFRGRILSFLCLVLMVLIYASLSEYRYDDLHFLWRLLFCREISETLVCGKHFSR